MHDIKDIFFVGGFGTVQWIDVDEYIHAQPDPVVVACTSSELQVSALEKSLVGHSEAHCHVETQFEVLRRFASRPES